jgi:hypothetical protein
MLWRAGVVSRVVAVSLVISSKVVSDPPQAVQPRDWQLVLLLVQGLARWRVSP